MEGTSRRQFIARGALLAAAAAGVPALSHAAAAPQPKTLRKLLDIGPGGVIAPGSAQDLRVAAQRGLLRRHRDPLDPLWADWPSLQPDGERAPDDPLSPGRANLRALDEQIGLANRLGIHVMLMPYRFPRWANGTEDLAGEAPGGKALEYLLPDDPYGPGSAWAAFFAFLHDRYHAGREAGRCVDGFELVNEPNLQLWPQQAPPPPAARGARPDEAALAAAEDRAGHLGRATRTRRCSTRPRSPTTTPPTSEPLHALRASSCPPLLDALAAIGYLPHSRQAWSHHNYTDVEQRQTRTRTPGASGRC